jgi:hypothetical protein
VFTTAMSSMSMAVAAQTTASVQPREVIGGFLEGRGWRELLRPWEDRPGR